MDDTEKDSSSANALGVCFSLLSTSFFFFLFLVMHNCIEVMDYQLAQNAALIFKYLYGLMFTYESSTSLMCNKWGAKEY